MKPTASPRLKRPWASSRAAGATAPVRTRARASLMARAFSSTERVGASASAAASPACWLVVGATSTSLSDSWAACWAAMITFGLFGISTTSSAATAWTPASRS